MRARHTSIPLLLSLLTFTACSGSGGGGGGGTVRVTPSAALSSLLANPMTAPADGTTQVLLTVTVRDTQGTALGDREVQFETTGLGAVLSATSVIADATGIASTTLTSTVPGPVIVTATVSPGSDPVRIDSTLTITFTAVDAPIVAGPARYEDTDGNAALSAGDKLIVPFSTDVVVNGATVGDFTLPVQGDSFGVGATVAAGAASNEVTITLGTEPVLRTRGRFDPAFTNDNEPSGIDVQSGAGIVAASGGDPAASSTPTDIGPIPVAQAPVAVGGDLIAVGDANGNSTPDVLVASNGTLSAMINSGGVLSPENTFPGGQQINDLAVANLNRIGAAEALTAQASGVQVWNNSAVGGGPTNYTQVQLVQTGDTRCVTVADLNADGFPDILAGTTSSVVIALHQRNLGNTYNIDQTISMGAATFDLRAVDVDGDGDLDVLAAMGGGGVRVLRNDNGQLVPDDQIAIAEAGSLAIGDLDGDGRIDFVVGGAVVNAVLNKATGFEVTTLTNVAAQVALVDLDKDSFVDLVARTTSGIEYLLNDRTGSFLPFGSNTQAGLTEIAYVDLDKDGDEEIVAVEAANTRTFAGSLAGSFGKTLLEDTRELGNGDVGKQVLGDLNHDGNIDRIVATLSGAQVWLGDGVGGFNVATTFGNASPTAIALGDMNGDLDLDCVLGFSGSNEIYFNDGLGNFSLATSFAPGSQTLSFGLTDFEQDGDLDVFVGNDGTNQLFLNDGSSTLTEAPSVFQGVLPQALANETIAVLVLDFDRDGDEDIILINGGDISSPQNAYTLRTSFNGYTLLNTLNAQLLATGAALGDVDNDGRTDLAIAQLSPAGNASIKWFRGFATSISTLPTNVATNGQYLSRSLIIADITGDGRSDFVVGDASVSNQPIAVLRQLANGDFEVFQEKPTTRLEQIGAGDFDKDGDVDLVTVETTGPSRVLENR